MAGEKSSKGNPASHRMTNAALKSRRAASWRRGEEGKAARRTAQDKAHRDNVATVKDGGMTPWQASKAARAARRASKAA